MTVDSKRLKENASEMYEILKSIETMHGVYGILGDSPSSQTLARRISDAIRRVEAGGNSQRWEVRWTKQPPSMSQDVYVVYGSFEQVCDHARRIFGFVQRSVWVYSSQGSKPCFEINHHGETNRNTPRVAGTLASGQGLVTMGDEAAAMPPCDRFDGLSPADLAQIDLLGGEG